MTYDSTRNPSKGARYGGDDEACSSSSNLDRKGAFASLGVHNADNGIGNEIKRKELGYRKWKLS
jgi:hypothetical protein